MLGWLPRLIRHLIGDTHDDAWKATGLKFVTARDYDEKLAIAKARAARRRSPTGRVYPRPVKRTADVVPFRKAGSK